MVVAIGYNNPLNAYTPGIPSMKAGIWSASALTQYQVPVSGPDFTLVGVTPSATSGVPFISQGSSANAAFGTAVVAGGGTGLTSATAYAVLCGGTTSTGAFQSVASVGTSGQVLTSNGAGALPSFQAVSASGAITTITGNSGGAQSPSAGNFNILGTGSIITAGTVNTQTIQLTGLTNHNILVGAGTATITKVPPSANSGIPFISQGISADPTYGTAVVGGGGTGRTSFNAYGPIYGGTSSTSALQSATPSATLGIPFISQGVASDPIYGTAVVAGGGTGSTSFNTYGPVVAASSGTGALTSVSPSATSGIPFVSQGSSANPAFSTAVVAGGGTGVTSTTAYAPITGGTTSTGALQSASTGLSTSGFVFRSNGSSALPSFVDPSGLSLARISQVKQTVFTANGTYTPTSGMAYVWVLAVGGGGGGGGVAATSGSQYAAASGGGGGGYAVGLFTAATIGASQSITIGGGGAGGSAGNNNGANGNNTTFGSLLTGNAGLFGLGGSAQSTVYIQGGGLGGLYSGGNYGGLGGQGGHGITLASAGSFISGMGGSTVLGGGASTVISGAGNNGTANTGVGGSGACNGPSGSAAAGGNGAAGIVILIEYIAS